MKQKHIDIRIEQCLALAKASNCPRRKLAALLLDPTRNVVLADGYNGGPREAEGKLCRGHYCERDGLTMDDLFIVEGTEGRHRSRGGWALPPEIVDVAHVKIKGSGEILHTIGKGPLDGVEMPRAKPGVCESPEDFLTKPLSDDEVELVKLPTAKEKATAWAQDLCNRTPAIQSGTQIEKGCHHAEMNVICNAAARGVACQGAWMIVLAEPCIMCAKLIHHAGIEKVILVGGGYLGGTAGVDYLEANGVQVQIVEGPKDPRLESQ